MKTAKIFWATLVAVLLTNQFNAQSPEEKSWENYPKTISLLFAGKPQSQSVKTDVDVVTFVPLRVNSAKVKVIDVIRGPNQRWQGFALSDDLNKSAGGKTPFYIFNNATQCFEYGYIETVNGQNYWTAGTAAEQIAHNVCAPKGEMYCRPKT